MEHKQASFSAGELAPEFWGRSDLPHYAHGLRTCRNMLPTIPGPVTNRPGSYYLGQSALTPSAEYPNYQDIALIPFPIPHYGRFMVEIIGGTYRVWADGALHNINGGGTPTENTFPACQTPGLIRYVQYVGPSAAAYAQMVIVNSEFKPQLLTFNSTNGYFTIADFPFTRTQAAPTVMTGLSAGSSSWFAVSAVSASGEESLALVGTHNKAASDFVTTPVVLGWTAASGAAYYKVYRGDHSAFYGFVGQAASNSFVDAGATPDYGRNPQITAVTPFSSLYPNAVAIHQQRLIFANTSGKRATIWTSQVGQFSNFNTNAGYPDDDPVTVTLATQTHEEITDLVSQRKLFAFTDAAEYTVGGTDGPATFPANPGHLEAISRTRWGTGAIDSPQPVAIDSAILHPHGLGGGVREIKFADMGLETESRDLTMLVQHLLDGYQIVSWAFARRPYQVLWVVRSDGKMLSFTYSRTAEVWAWAQHDTYRGRYIYVACIAGPFEDQVYAAVNRAAIDNEGFGNNTFIEMFSPRSVRRPFITFGNLPSEADELLNYPTFLDATSVYDGENKTAHTMTLSAIASADPGAAATLTASAATFAASNVGDEVHIFYKNVDNDTTAGNPLIRCRIVSYSSTTVVHVELVNGLPDAWTPGSPPSATAVWALAVDTIATPDYLNHYPCKALVDGSVVSGLVPTALAVTLPNPGIKVYLGIPVEAQIETLDLAVQAGRQKVKTVRKVSFEVTDTRGIYTGEDYTHLAPWVQEQIDNEFGAPALETGLAEVAIESSWNTGGRAVLQQSDPLPVTVLALLREVEVGGVG